MLGNVRSRVIWRKQELFCLPAYQDEAQIDHIRRDITGHLATWYTPRRPRKKKQNKTKTNKTKHNQQKGAEVFKPQKSPITISGSPWCAFQKLSALGAQAAAWPRFRAEQRSPGAQRPERRSLGGSSPVVVVVVSSGSPGTGRARWTAPSDTRARSGGRGLSAPSSFVGRRWFTRAPESSPH